MYERLKIYLKNFQWVVKLHKLILRGTWWLSDLRSALLSRKMKMKMTPYGFKLIGSNSIHHLRMQEGDFEPEEVILFQDLFKEADVFVDVGANIGFYTCLAQQSGVYAIAVEPLQKNLEYLYNNLIENDWKTVEVFPVGLAEETGVATLFGGSSTGASLIGQWAGASQMFRQNISLLTLDILLSDRFSGKGIFIKIDVEGAEYSTLLGAVNTMKMQPKPTWVVEICLSEHHPKGVNPYFHDTFKLFWENGYEVRTADKNNRLIQSADVEHWVKCGQCDSGTINYKFSPLE